MKHTTWFRVCLSILIIVSLLLWQPTSFAAGTTGPAGPQGHVGTNPDQLGPQTTPGVSGDIGPHGEPGNAGLVGPQAQPGVQGEIGPQGTVGSTRSQPTPTPNQDSQASTQPGSNAQNSSSGANNTGSNQTAPNQSQPLQATSSGGPSPSSSASNNQTGANSDNQSTINKKSDQEIGVNSSQTITNTITGKIDTGNNVTSANTGSGAVETGKIVGTVNILNVANSQVVAGSGGISQQSVGNSQNDIVLGDPAHTTPLSAIVLDSLAGNASATNSETGANSNNQATITKIGDTNIRVSNDTAVDNDINLMANTGNNQANSNTGIGKIVTGSIEIAVNIINFLNTYLTTDYLGLAFLDVVGTLSGDVILPGSSSASNTNTGTGSSNNSAISSSSSLKLTKESDANVNNSVNVNSQTGNNQANANTLGASIETGKTDVDVNSATLSGEIPADSLLFVLVNEIGEGEWTGQVIGADPNNVIVAVQKVQPATALESSNAKTGVNSVNNASINEDQSTTITEANNAKVNNSVNVQATTGNNSTSFNTSGGNIQTGNVNVAANMVNFVNASGKAFKKVVIAVINVFGKWTGNLVFGSKKPVTIPSTQTNQTQPNPAQGVAVASVTSTPSTPSSETATVLASAQTVPSPSTVTSAVQPTTASTPPSAGVSATTQSSSSPTIAQEAKQQSTQRTSTTGNRSSTLLAAANESVSEPQVQELSTNSEENQPSETQGARYPMWAYALIVVVAIAAGTLVAYSRKPTE